MIVKCPMHIADSSDFLGLNVYFGMKAAYRQLSDPKPSMTVPGVGQVAEELPYLSLSLDVHGNDTDMMAGYTSVSTKWYCQFSDHFYLHVTCLVCMPQTHPQSFFQAGRKDGENLTYVVRWH